MTESWAKMYVVFLCINIALMLGGQTITGSADLANKTYGADNSSKAAGDSNIVTMVWSYIYDDLAPVAGFLLGAGIINMLQQAGMPSEIQWIIGTPLAVLAFLSFWPVIKGIAGLIAKVI